MTRLESRSALAVAFLLALFFSAVEFGGALWSRSLALAADAGHMLGDAGVLALAFMASLLASKRATARMTYGFYRVEILSALVNASVLFAIAYTITREALERFRSPADVQSLPMFFIAALGLAVNVGSGFLLGHFRSENINLRGAFWHVVSDALSSIAVILGALAMAWTGWLIIDPLLSVLISGFIVAGAWRLLRDVVEVLLEATPRHVDMARLEQSLLAVPGVLHIHDLHVWSISSGKVALSCHLEVGDEAEKKAVLKTVTLVAVDTFNIRHSTFQIETASERGQNGRPSFHE